MCLLTFLDSQAPSPTPFPAQFRGDWYSLDRGKELYTIINKQQMMSEKISDSECVGVQIFNNTIDAQGYYDGRILVHDKYGPVPAPVCLLVGLDVIITNYAYFCNCKGYVLMLHHQKQITGSAWISLQSQHDVPSRYFWPHPFIILLYFLAPALGPLRDLRSIHNPVIFLALPLVL